MRSETGKRKNWCGSVTLIRLSWWGVKQQWRPTDPLALRVPLIRLPYEEWNLRLRRTKAAREGCYINLITLWGVKHFRPHTSPSSAQVAVIWFLLWGVKLRLGPNLNLTDRVAIIWFLLWGVKPASASRIFLAPTVTVIRFLPWGVKPGARELGDRILIVAVIRFLLWGVKRTNS